MKKTSISKRFAALFLAVVMCLSLFPISAFAENEPAAAEPSAAVEVQDNSAQEAEAAAQKAAEEEAAAKKAAEEEAKKKAEEEAAKKAAEEEAARKAAEEEAARKAAEEEAARKAAEEEAAKKAAEEEAAKKAAEEEAAKKAAEEEAAKKAAEEEAARLAEEEAAKAHFKEGLVYINKKTDVYAAKDLKVKSGTFTAKSVVYAENVKEADDKDNDILKITFETEETKKANGKFGTAYIKYKEVTPLTEEETDKLQNSLKKDKTARAYKKHLLSLVSFKPIVPKAKERDEEKEEESKSGEIVTNGAIVSNGTMTVTLSPSKALGLSLNESGKIKAIVKNNTGNVSYQWQMSTDGGATWSNLTSTGYNTATLTTKVNEKNYTKIYNYRFRCQVKDSKTTVISAETKLKALFTVKAPTSVKGGIGDKVKITATITDNYLSGNPTYQWQRSTDGGKTWKNCTYTGYNTKTVTVTVTENQFSNSYRCMVTIDGKQMPSAPIAIKKPYTVTLNKKKAVVEIGSTDSFKVTTKGTTGSVTYQWQFSANGGSTWKNAKLTGYSTATVSIKATNELDGYLYRCKITAGNGTLYSDSAYIEPGNVSYFTYADNGSGKWIITGYTGPTATFTMPAGKQGKAVVGIGASAFKGIKVKNIVIPPSIISIGDSAFENCTALTSVTLSDNVTSFGKAAFKNCTKLSNMKIKNK